MKQLGRNLKAFTILSGSLTAAGTGDNTMITSETVQLTGFESGKLIIGAKASLGSGDTLKSTITLQHSPDQQTWTSIVVADEATMGTGASGGSANVHLNPIEYDFNANSFGRYVRTLITPDLSRAGTDVAIVSGYIVAGGSWSNPVTRA